MKNSKSMHIHSFADLVSFEAIGIGGTLPQTETYQDFFKKLHPSQMLKSRISVPIYEVEYSYFTRRGNYKHRKKYIMLKTEHEDLDVEIEMVFHDWVDEVNRNKPYRKISNAQILEIKPVAYAKLYIDC